MLRASKKVRREKERKAQEERREREVEAQEGHDGEQEMVTQEKCVGAKEGSAMQENDVLNRHMTWWRDVWCACMDNIEHLRTVRGRRRVWRVATRALRETRETESVAGEKWEQGNMVRKRKQHTARCPLPNSNNPSSSGSSQCACSNGGSEDKCPQAERGCDRGRVTSSRRQRARLPSFVQR